MASWCCFALHGGGPSAVHQQGRAQCSASRCWRPSCCVTTVHQPPRWRGCRRMVSLSAWWWPGECRRSRWQKEACLFCVCHQRERESKAGRRYAGRASGVPSSSTPRRIEGRTGAGTLAPRILVTRKASHRIAWGPPPVLGPALALAPAILPLLLVRRARRQSTPVGTYPMPRARSTATPCVMAHAWSETPIHHQHSQESQARTCRIPPHSLSAASPPPEPGLFFPAATADAGEGGKRERGGANRPHRGSRR